MKYRENLITVFHHLEPEAATSLLIDNIIGDKSWTLSSSRGAWRVLLRTVIEIREPGLGTDSAETNNLQCLSTR